jgi:hypothetical protein
MGITDLAGASLAINPSINRLVHIEPASILAIQLAKHHDFLLANGSRQQSTSQHHIVGGNVPSIDGKIDFSAFMYFYCIQKLYF